MKEKMQPSVSEMFDQAVESFDTAMRTGVKMQEEAARWWSGMMLESDTKEGMQQRMRAMVNDAIPVSRRNFDQYLQIFDRTYHSSMEMLKKALEMSQCDSLATAQIKTQELWETSLAMMRNNAQMLVQLNARAMESWSEFASRDIAGQAAPMASAMAEKVASAANEATQAAARAAASTVDQASATAERMSKRTAATQRTAMMSDRPASRRGRRPKKS